jgi:transketolase
MGETQEQLIKLIASRARRMRKHSLDMALAAGAKGAHLGPGFSMVEIMATLYTAAFRHDPNNPQWPDRDMFILSKGHGVLGYYTILAECGYFPMELLKTFETKDSPLAGHPSIHRDLGIDFSTGSLGHGLSLGVGTALAARMDGRPSDTYVYMGDGECDEGTVWEAAMAARQFRLDNLVAIVDRNRIQSDGFSRDILDLGDMAEKWRSFGWSVREVDGHDIPELLNAFHHKSRPSGLPYVIVANTVKGKGVSFFENSPQWHHNKLTRQQYTDAMAELGYDENGEDILK